MPARIEDEKRHLIKRLYWSGVARVQIERQVGVSYRFISKLLGLSPWKPRKRNGLRLTRAEREEIALGLAASEALRSIARRLKRAPSTVSREIRRQQDSGSYRGWRADDQAERLMARPKSRKLDSSPKLVREVERLLAKKWSPREIEQHLRLVYSDPAMHVSHETIYKTLYLQGRGALKKELTKHLRQGRDVRKPRPREELRGKIRDMVNISQRPPEVADRAVPGHWEGDLITGAKHGSYIATLVERSTRYVMLLHLPNGRSAQHVREALARKILQLPKELRKSLTWDQGKELSEHAQFTIDTGVQVYFCDPHSPWQRGSNENTNGLLRQYFPKGTDLSVHSEAELDRVARELNERPRQTLGWRSPAQRLNELLQRAA
ncbi:MAG: IS30 family transposase [Myxococcaceae bacterium]